MTDPTPSWAKIPHLLENLVASADAIRVADEQGHTDRLIQEARFMKTVVPHVVAHIRSQQQEIGKWQTQAAVAKEQSSGFHEALKVKEAQIEKVRGDTIREAADRLYSALVKNGVWSRSRAKSVAQALMDDMLHPLSSLPQKC